MINRVVLLGRLARDPELRRTSTGTAVTTLSVAFDSSYSKENNKSNFVRVSVFNKTAEYICNYGKKGSQLVLEGRLQENKYQRQDGTNVSTIEIIADNIQLTGSAKSNTNATSDSVSLTDSTMDDDVSIDDVLGNDVADDDLPF